MFTSTKARSSLLSKMRAYIATATAPQRIETLVTALAGVDWGALDEKDKRIVDGMFRTCGWARGRWPHWYPVGDPRRLPAGIVAQPDAGSTIKGARAEGASYDRWGAAIERAAA